VVYVEAAVYRRLEEMVEACCDRGYGDGTVAGLIEAMVAEADL
jgi:hypothetical protein